ncbi:hypothetical protein LCGC14_1531360 [marine sediment metagenome]|uniref:Uncharacterized protein n=1 Tax=marine sediment metagenome TaxID=412755 RepID=A0A0F9IVR1_9ZZZZ
MARGWYADTEGVLCGYFNGDAILDVVATGRATYVVMGNGDGTFADPIYISTGTTYAAAGGTLTTTAIST